MPTELVYVAGCCLRTHAGDFAGWGIYGGDRSPLNDSGAPFEQTNIHAELFAIMHVMKKIYSWRGSKIVILTRSYDAYCAIEELKDINGPEGISNDQSQTLNVIRTLLNLADKNYVPIEVRVCSMKTPEFNKAYESARAGAQSSMNPTVEPSYLDSLQKCLQ